MAGNVLMVAFHFPPAAMGSGHLRTLGFARYLPESGWNPIVLSACAAAYPRTSPVEAGVIPADCAVYRGFALDAGRHLAIMGKYPGFLAQPDRWATWWPAALCQGLRLIRRHRVRAIWSTYPVMTAHCIARSLSRIAKLPWIADFRDPVCSSVSASNRFAVASQQRWERRVLGDATCATFTTPGALRHYAENYPRTHAQGRLALIENGYDEAAFAGLSMPARAPDAKPLVLLHSGLLYPQGRNPLPFFHALAHLKADGAASADDIKIVLRASGSETTYAEALRRLGIDDMVDLAPPVTNREALQEQAEADALLLFQGTRYDRQIPAKVYEYLRIGRPIFALAGPRGDTAALLRRTGGAELVPMDDSAAIATRLAEFIQRLRAGQAPSAAPDMVRACTRRQSAALLGGLLDRVVGEARRSQPMPAAPRVESTR